MKSINVQGGFLFRAGWNFLKLVSVTSRLLERWEYQKWLFTTRFYFLIPKKFWLRKKYFGHIEGPENRLLSQKGSYQIVHATFALRCVCLSSEGRLRDGFALSWNCFLSNQVFFSTTSSMNGCRNFELNSGDLLEISCFPQFYWT